MIEAQLGIHNMLELSALVFELLWPLHLACLRSAVYRSPGVERGVAATVFTTGLLHAACFLSAGGIPDKTKLCAALPAEINPLCFLV